MFKLFGGRKKPAKAKPRKAAAKAPRTPPGEGIRQLAAALPHSDDAPPARPAPAPEAAASPQGQAQPQPQPQEQVAEAPAPTPEPLDRARLIREAMRIRRDKARDLDNISPRDRKRLQQLAEKMMGVAPDEPGSTDAAPPPGRKGGPSGTRH